MRCSRQRVTQRLCHWENRFIWRLYCGKRNNNNSKNKTNHWENRFIWRLYCGKRNNNNSKNKSKLVKRGLYSHRQCYSSSLRWKCCGLTKRLYCGKKNNNNNKNKSKLVKRGLYSHRQWYSSSLTRKCCGLTKRSIELAVKRAGNRALPFLHHADEVTSTLSPTPIALPNDI